MPHVIVKLWPGKSEQQKRRLAEAITKDVMDILHYGDESVSVAMEEVKSNEWIEKVYNLDPAHSEVPATPGSPCLSVCDSISGTLTLLHFWLGKCRNAKVSSKLNNHLEPGWFGAFRRRLLLP